MAEGIYDGNLNVTGAYLINGASWAPAGTGIISSGTLGQIAYYGSAGTTVSGKALANADLPNGLTNRNTGRQQFQLATTSTYITSSNINMPASFIGSGITVGTTFSWRYTINKTANGTGTFSFIIHMGTNGSASDAAIVTQAIAHAQTAVVDTMTVDIMLTVTTAGASGVASWSICPISRAATNAGFGIAIGTTGVFQGTASSLNFTTGSLIFGLGVLSTTGGTQATVDFPLVQAQAFNLS